MKILLYSEHQKLIEKSGVGRALHHQQKALSESGVEFTLDQNDDYDLVHINTIFPGSFMMSRRAKKQGKKVIYHAHSTEEDFRNSFIGSNLVSPLFKKWIKACYESSDLILTPTSYSKKLLQGYGIKKEINAISNGIDLSRFKRNLAARIRFRNKYGFKECDKVILSVGLFIERKGILDFVELAKKMPEYQFVWCGYSDLWTIPKEIRQAVKTELPNLHFPGYVPKEEMCDAYSGADLFLFLTHEETEGIVLLEAIAANLPILLRDIPIYNDWLVENEHVYKGKNIAEFEKKIRMILQGELPTITSAAYEVAENRAIAKIGEQLAGYYRELLA